MISPYPASAKKPLMPTKIVMVWAMALIGLFIFSLVWFVLTPVVFQFLGAMENAFDFNAQSQQTLELYKITLYWFPILTLLGIIMWGYLNSQRRDVRQWEV